MLEEKFTVYHDVYHQFRTEGKQQYCVCMGPNGEPALFKEGWKWDLTGMKDQEVKSRTSSSVQHSMGWIEAVLEHRSFPNPPLCHICFSLGPSIFLAAPLAPREQPAPRLCPQQAWCIPCAHWLSLSPQEQPGPGPSWVSAELPALTFPCSRATFSGKKCTMSCLPKAAESR